MPELHRGAVVHLKWDLTLDEPLTDAMVPTVAVYQKGTVPDPIEWLQMEWAGPGVELDGIHTRTAQLLVAGPDADTPPPGSLVLPAVVKYANHVRVMDGLSERLVGTGEPITVKP